MDVKAKFEDKKGFEISLTDDKVYVTAIGSQETFALRSVNGIGTYDDIEDYNKQLEANKIKDHTLLKPGGITFGVLGVIFAVTLGKDFYILAAFTIIVGIIFYAIGANAKSAEEQSEMKSYFRIMLSGGDRKFQFDKKASNAKDVADFCNKVEDTLTAYNKQ